MDEETRVAINRLASSVERLRDMVTTDQPIEASAVLLRLQRIEDGQVAQTVEVSRMADHLWKLADKVGIQNKRLDKVEWAQVEQQKLVAEREKWLEEQSKRHDRVLASGLALAGLLSGVVFGALRLVLG